MGGNFSREQNEENLCKKAAVGNKYKTVITYITVGISLAAWAFLTVVSAGTILLIDGGITLGYLVITLSFSIHEKLINKYLKYISACKKRDFKNYLCSFYEKILTNETIDKIKSIVNDFILKEDILKKVDEKFEQNRNKFINDSNEFRNKFNILLIGPTGSGKSTLINELLNLTDNKAREGIGDAQTMAFKEYTSKNSQFNFIDSQGFDLSRPISEFSKIIQSKIKSCNEHPKSFIDMIYYCTNNMNRFQTQEAEVINELKKLFNLDRIPLIIVFTQCYFEEDYINMKEFIKEKYKKENFTILRVIARQKGSILPYGINELKTLTLDKVNNIHESAYSSKFIANISQKLFKEYTNSYFSSFIKGIFSPDKEKSFKNLFINIFNMYRFEKSELPQSFMDDINEEIKIIIKSYEDNLDLLTYKIIDLHAESCIIRDYKLNKDEELSDEYEIKKETKKSILIDKEFQGFSEDIDIIVFPCCLDVLKIEIIKIFNEHIFAHLKPKIEELMAHH